MDRYTGRRDITQILLKAVLNTIQSVKQILSLTVARKVAQITMDFKGINSFRNDKSKILPNLKSLQMTISNLIKMAENSPKGLQKLWKKGEIARYEQFLFSHGVFKRLVLQVKEIGLVWERVLNDNKFRKFLNTLHHILL